MKVSEVMTRDVCTIAPEATLQQAGKLMAELDVGSLPVAENDKLIGMITDRDIVVRAVGQGRGPQTPVRDAMTHDIKYAYDDQSIADISLNMGNLQVRRLPVVTRDKSLVGILSLGDIARREADDAGEALQDISRPSNERAQPASGH